LTIKRFRRLWLRRFSILVVDDEERIITFLRSKLRASGYEVLTASNGRSALELVRSKQPDLMVLDIVMPQMDGMETLKELRSFSSLPVIMLSAKGTDMDKIKGLTLGADDYLAKPFNPDELVARIESLRRRAGETRQSGYPEGLRIGNITLDLEKCRVIVGEEEKQLTRIEWLLLSKLAQNAGRLMTYEELLTTIWGPEYRDDIQILRTWISRLRTKLGRDDSPDKIISTIPKVGYMMNVPHG